MWPDPAQILVKPEYGPLTMRELSEISSQPETAVQAEMKMMTANGAVGRLPVNSGEFWSECWGITAGTEVLHV